MRSECDPVEAGADHDRIRDAYVDNLRERFSKDHIYVSVEFYSANVTKILTNDDSAVTNLFIFSSNFIITQFVL